MKNRVARHFDRLSVHDFNLRAFGQRNLGIEHRDAYAAYQLIIPYPSLKSRLTRQSLKCKANLALQNPLSLSKFSYNPPNKE